MAWQLIYTSAPRLLDAGRSGFGTVARPRQMRALLTAAVERVTCRQADDVAGRFKVHHLRAD